MAVDGCICDSWSLLCVCELQHQVVHLLLEKGCNVNKETSRGYTPLMEAVRGGHADIVRSLVRHRAIVNYSNKNRMSAITLARRLGDRQELYEYLRYQSQFEAQFRQLFICINLADHTYVIKLPV